LRDALGILLAIEAKDDERFEPAAVRWAAAWPRRVSLGNDASAR